VYSILPQKETLAKAKAAAVAAVAFDDELAEAHTSLAFIRVCFDWDWAGAEKEFQRALELNPGYWVTPYWYAITLTAMGRFDEAEPQIRRSVELEPLSAAVLHEAIWNSLSWRRYDEAVERSLKALEIDPNYFLVRYWLGLTYVAQKKYPEAIRELQTAVDLCRRGVSWVVGALGHAYALAGNREEALRLLEELLEREKRETIDFLSLALIYVGLGDTENALLSLEKSCEARGMVALFTKTDERYDTLRSEPRFQNVLKRVNLG